MLGLLARSVRVSESRVWSGLEKHFLKHEGRSQIMEGYPLNAELVSVCVEVEGEEVALLLTVQAELMLWASGRMRRSEGSTVVVRIQQCLCGKRMGVFLWEQNR